jgi:hypothetical protein
MLLLLLRDLVVLLINTGITMMDGGRTIKHIPLL